MIVDSSDQVTDQVTDYVIDQDNVLKINGIMDCVEQYIAQVRNLIYVLIP